MRLVPLPVCVAGISFETTLEMQRVGLKDQKFDEMGASIRKRWT
jgi:hypothetical protein